MDLNFSYILPIAAGLIGVIGIIVIAIQSKNKPVLRVTQSQPVSHLLSLKKLSSKEAKKETLSEDVKPVTTEFELVTTEGVMNAIVLDDQHRSFGERHVELIKGKDYGRPLFYINNVMFYLHRFSNGDIEPVPSSPYENLEHSPGETYDSVKNDEDVRTLFAKKNKSDTIKIWMFILGALAALFIMWMAYSSRSGN